MLIVPPFLIFSMADATGSRTFHPLELEPLIFVVIAGCQRSQADGKIVYGCAGFCRRPADVMWSRPCGEDDGGSALDVAEGENAIFIGLGLTRRSLNPDNRALNRLLATHNNAG